MELMTSEIKELLEQHPVGSTEGKLLDAEVIVKYFNPCGSGTWLIFEGSPTEDGDYELFGLCHIFEWEFGSVMLSELQNVRLPLGLTIERDLYSHGTVRKLAMECGYVPCEDD